jgi:glucokinase
MTGLVADIGSTNARFALAAAGATGLQRTAVYPCSAFPSLGEAVRRYLGTLPEGERPSAGTLAVAGPVGGDEIYLTNHDWRFSVEGLRRELGFSRLHVINDFTAIALSLPALPPASLASVGPAYTARPTGVLGLIGPGTGLGVGGLICRENRPSPIASEGGHVTFAPQDETEWALNRILAGRFGHVSNERLLSGPGIENIFAGLAQIRGVDRGTLPAAEITERAAAGTDALCRETLETFCAILGRAAGDLALTLFADAVFVAGGIVPRFVDFLRASRFREAFAAKGRFARHLAAVPTVVIVEPHPGLLGAAAHLQAHADTASATGGRP